MSKVTARLEISVYINCPHCDFMIDLTDERDTNNHNHDDEGLVLSQACPDGDWHSKHKDFEVNDVTCSECKGEISVRGLEW